MKELLSEVWESIKHHKLRVCIMCFSVGWALFILIFLLGSGNGIMSSMNTTMGTDTICYLNVMPGIIQQPYAGKRSGQPLILTVGDAEYLKKHMGSKVHSVEMSSSSDAMPMTYKRKYTTAIVKGITENYLEMTFFKMTEGHQMSTFNQIHGERVCLISSSTRNILFDDGESPLGKKVDVGGEIFTVIGVYEVKKASQICLEVFVPFITAQRLYHPDNVIFEMKIRTTNRYSSSEEMDTFIAEVYKVLGNSARFDVNDRSALCCTNTTLTSMRLTDILEKTDLYVWLIGIVTLFFGMTNVSNIMLISVGERIKEFGVRKVMGATDAHIFAMVIIETLAITLMAGYVGMMIAICMLRSIGWIVAAKTGSDFFSDTSVSLGNIIASFLTLLVAGILAGLAPSVKASKAKLVDSLL